MGRAEGFVTAKSVLEDELLPKGYGSFVREWGARAPRGRLRGKEGAWFGTRGIRRRVGITAGSPSLALAFIRGGESAAGMSGEVFPGESAV